MRVSVACLFYWNEESRSEGEITCHPGANLGQGLAGPEPRSGFDDFGFPPGSYSGTHVRRGPDGNIPVKPDKGPAHAQALIAADRRIAL